MPIPSTYALTLTTVDIGAAAAVTSITIDLTDSTGAPVNGYVGTGGASEAVIRHREYVSNSSGVFTIALFANADIRPANTYYTIFAGSRSWLIEKTAATQTLEAALVVSPAVLGSAGASSIALTAEAAARLAADIAMQAKDPELIIYGAITRDATEAATAAAVRWADGVIGTFVGTPSVAFPGAIDSYVLTKGAVTYTQPTMTRDAAGAIITRPEIVVT